MSTGLRNRKGPRHGNADNEAAPLVEEDNEVEETDKVSQDSDSQGEEMELPTCPDCGKSDSVTQMPCCGTVRCLYCIFSLGTADKSQLEWRVPSLSVQKDFVDLTLSGEYDEAAESEFEPELEGPFTCATCDKPLHKQIVEGAWCNMHLEIASLYKLHGLLRLCDEHAFDLTPYNNRHWFDDVIASIEASSRGQLIDNIYTHARCTLGVLRRVPVPMLHAMANELHATAMLAHLGQLPSTHDQQQQQPSSSSSSSSSRKQSSKRGSKAEKDTEDAEGKEGKDDADGGAKYVLARANLCLSEIMYMSVEGQRSGEVLPPEMQEQLLLDMSFLTYTKGEAVFHAKNILTLLNTSVLADEDCNMMRIRHLLRYCRTQARRNLLTLLSEAQASNSSSSSSSEQESNEDTETTGKKAKAPAADKLVIFWYTYHRRTVKRLRELFPGALTRKDDVLCLWAGARFFQSRRMHEASINNWSVLLDQCLDDTVVEDGWTALKLLAMREAVAGISVQLQSALRVPLLVKQHLFDNIQKHADQYGAIVDLEALRGHHTLCGNCGEQLPLAKDALEPNLQDDVLFVKTTHVCFQCAAVSYCSAKCMDEHYEDIHKDVCVMYTVDEHEPPSTETISPDDTDDASASRTSSMSWVQYAVYIFLSFLLWSNVLSSFFS